VSTFFYPVWDPFCFFFIQDNRLHDFSISFSMVSYFFLSVILKKYIFQFEQINFIRISHQTRRWLLLYFMDIPDKNGKCNL